MATPEPTESGGLIEMPLERFEEIGAEMERLRSALETVTAQSATALAKRDKAKQRARIAEAELEALRGGLREIGGDPTQVQNLYAQLSLSRKQARAAEVERDGLQELLAKTTAVADRQAAELAQHAACTTCGHERHQHQRDPILRAMWCRACTTLDDLHDFTPTTEETLS